MSGFLGRMLEGLGGGAPGADPQASGNLVGELLNSVGGVGGLIQKFNQAGLGDKVASWVGSGQNLPVAAQEVLKVFPQDQLEALAVKHGVPAGMVGQILAHVLPQAVDHATPDGVAPQASEDQGWA